MKSKSQEYKTAYWKAWRNKKKPYAQGVEKTCIRCRTKFICGPSEIAAKTCAPCRKPLCLSCSQPFTAGRIAMKYCSRKCHAESQKGREPENLARNRGRKPRTYFNTHRNKHGCQEDRDWRAAVFKRDDYTCQICQQKGGRLQADHIQPFSVYHLLRHDLANGRTLCIECHKATPTYGWKAYWIKVRSSKDEIAAKRMLQEVLPFEACQPVVEPLQLALG